MNRVDIIQAIIDKKRAKDYLEIGFSDCFFNIRVPRKTAVHPKISFFKREALRNFFQNFSNNILNRYSFSTSDDFFEENKELPAKKLFDVIFIDSLNTYGRSLKDVLNSLKYLKKDGVIVLRDCNPSSKIEAYPARSYAEVKNRNFKEWSGSWAGDVWKTVVYLKSRRPDLDVFVLDCDLGIGIIRKGKNSRLLKYAPEDIRDMSYAILEKNRRKMLSLKKPSYFKKFIDSI